ITTATPSTQFTTEATTTGATTSGTTGATTLQTTGGTTSGTLFTGESTSRFSTSGTIKTTVKSCTSSMIAQPVDGSATSLATSSSFNDNPQKIDFINNQNGNIQSINLSPGSEVLISKDKITFTGNETRELYIKFPQGSNGLLPDSSKLITDDYDTTIWKVSPSGEVPFYVVKVQVLPTDIIKVPSEGKPYTPETITPETLSTLNAEKTVLVVSLINNTVEYQVCQEQPTTVSATTTSTTLETTVVESTLVSTPIGTSTSSSPAVSVTETSVTTATGATTIETTVSGGTTVSGATTSGTTVSGATTLVTTVSGATTSGTTVSGATTLVTTVSGATTSGTTVSGATTSGKTVSGATTSGTTVPAATTSGTTVPAATTSGTTVSGATTSGTTVSGATTSGTTVSGETSKSTSVESTPTTITRCLLTMSQQNVDAISTKFISGVSVDDNKYITFIDNSDKKLQAIYGPFDSFYLKPSNEPVNSIQIYEVVYLIYVVSSTESLPVDAAAIADLFSSKVDTLDLPNNKKAFILYIHPNENTEIPPYSGQIYIPEKLTPDAVENAQQTDMVFISTSTPNEVRYESCKVIHYGSESTPQSESSPPPPEESTTEEITPSITPTETAPTGSVTSSETTPLSTSPTPFVSGPTGTTTPCTLQMQSIEADKSVEPVN
uniref:Uncharacterized protein n=1 Tax=Biomphalaria glabrata TaxID=6526 RepID=A0A2C9K676_BIOGL